MKLEIYPKIKNALDKITGQTDVNLTNKEVSADEVEPNQSQAGTTLKDASITATAHNETTFNWTIDKFVTPDMWNLFKGDTGTSQYTITVTKSAGTHGAFIDGQVCVTNGGEVATENLTITVNLTMPPSQTVIASINVDVNSNSVLDPGETGCYNYSIEIPSGSINPTATYKVTAHITITNHSGHLGEPFGPSPSATDILPQPSTVNDTIHVDDTNGQSFIFSDSGSASYTKTYSCPDDEGTHTNTAIITETGQTATATVTVNCYELKVTKTSNTSFTKTYTWSIDKEADQSYLTLQVGESATVNYTITVNATASDSGWEVLGTIDVYNPAPIAATITNISDIIQPDNISATVNCSVTFPYLLPAGGTLTCTYNANLIDRTDKINIATATLQNYDYTSDGTATASGTTDFTGEAPINFENANVIEVNKCVEVVDDFAGLLGYLCFDKNPLPQIFNYNRQIGPYDLCGEYEVTNTAEVKSTDPEPVTLDSNYWTVNIHVPCRGLLIEIIL